MSEEFFINCLGVLIIIKFSELNDKNNLLSFNLICIVIAIASLIKGQDIISTLTSIALVILIVVNMYLIQHSQVVLQYCVLIYDVTCVTSLNNIKGCTNILWSSI